MTACFKAMNDWSIEFAGAYPDKLTGVALLNMDEVEDGLAELERCAKLGMSAAAIPTFPGEENLYSLPRFEPFWSRAEELGIPLGMHSGSERPGPGRVSIGDSVMKVQTSRDASWRVTLHYWAMRSVADMIFSGVFEEHPSLRLAVVEHDVGWVPHFVRRMDMSYAEHRYVTEISFKNGKLPSDFIRNNVYFTFMEDPIFIPFLSMLGADHVMWGSDYPHRESTWPRSRQVLNQLLEGLPEEEQGMITYGNAAKLYGMN
jgi:predicted TIM-barrel fold metal-dependent hydrolase